MKEPNIVTMWIASFNSYVDDLELTVLPCKVKVTPKRWTIIKEDSKESRDAIRAVGYTTQFQPNSNRLHNTKLEALESLHQQLILKTASLARKADVVSRRRMLVNETIKELDETRDPA